MSLETVRLYAQRPMKVHAQSKPLTEPLPGGKRGATVTVEPLLGGELDSPPTFFERPGGPWKR